MAIELASGEFGLIDPLGGRLDLTGVGSARSIRSRTSRIRLASSAPRATRPVWDSVGRATARSRALALRLVPYSALSGQRIAAEIEHILGETRAGTSSPRLGRSGAFACSTRAIGSPRRAGAASASFPAPRHGRTDTPSTSTSSGWPPRACRRSAAGRRRCGAGAARLLRWPAGRPQARARDRRGARRGARPSLGPSERARLLRSRAPLELACSGSRWARPARGRRLFVGIDPRSCPGRRRVVALGVPRGPAVARVLAEVRDARLDGTLTNRAMEEEHVRQWLTRGG
jgi:hypothetical protein